MCKLVLFSKMDQELNPEQMKKIYDKFLSMINKDNPKVGYIASETDKERKYFDKTKKYYEMINISNLTYFDLEDEYKKENEEALFSSDVIHLSSGNTYKFLSLLKKRNMIEKLKEYALNGGVIVGVSAGSLIVAQTIGSAQFGDENEVGITDLSALGLIDFEIMPHWNNWSHYLEDLKKYSKEENVPMYTVEDGDGIVVEDENIYLYGNIGKIEGGVYNALN